MSRWSSRILFLALLVLVTGFLGTQSAAAGQSKDVEFKVSELKKCMKLEVNKPPEAVGTYDNVDNWLLACLKNGGLDSLKKRCMQFEVWCNQNPGKVLDVKAVTVWWNKHKLHGSETGSHVGFRHIVGSAWGYLMGTLKEFPSPARQKDGKSEPAKAMDAKPTPCQDCMAMWGCVFCIPPCTANCQ